MFTDGRLTRRQALLGALVASPLLRATSALAHARIPMGGSVSLRVPWPLATIDPHRLGDAGAMLFGAAVFDSLYAHDASGHVVPALAESMPEESPSGVRITLRQGVELASGKALTSRDVAFALARARSLDAGAWLDALGPVRVLGPSALSFGMRGASLAAELLASPLAAIVPVGFAPERPDGTGPFAVSSRGDARVFTRNARAAQGPAFLDSFTVVPAPDLASSLRAFEAGEDDLGWLGLGLHEPRRSAVAFEAGFVGWATLRTGDQGGRWNAPGVAQRLADGIDPSRLEQLGVRDTRVAEPDDGWGGPPASLLVRSDSPWLVELARAVAAALSRPDHEVTVRPVSPAELAAARASRAYALAIDTVRPFASSPLGTRLALATAEDPVRAKDLARHPPRGSGPEDPRVLGRLSRVGVVAEIRVGGGRMPDVTLPVAPGGGLDFGAIMRPRSGVL